MNRPEPPPVPSEVHLAGRLKEGEQAEAPETRFQPLGAELVEGYLFEQALGLLVSRAGRQVLRVDGGEFFLPRADSGACEFSVDSRRYIVLGEQHSGREQEGAWHVLQVRPRQLHIQRIKTVPGGECPLFFYDGQRPELAVDDASVCGFDGDDDCRLTFPVWYVFRGHFRPDYGLGYEAPSEDYLDGIMWRDWSDVPEGRMAPTRYWEVLLNLITAGQVEAASEFLEVSFPGGEDEQRVAVAGFVKRLRSSRHYPGILRLNRGRMVH